MAVVIAVDVNQDGQREVLGLNVGPSEDEGVGSSSRHATPLRTRTRASCWGASSSSHMLCALRSCVSAARGSRCGKSTQVRRVVLVSDHGQSAPARAAPRSSARA
jgi:Transposase, Mutator family